MSTMGNGSALFTPASPGLPVTTVLLIENSQNMMAGWSDLRDCYLPNLLGNIRVANPIVPIQVLVFPTSSVPNESGSGPSRHGSSDLLELHFDTRVPNRISPGHISRAVDSLASCPGSRHLVVIAASSPCDDPAALEVLSSIDAGASLWQLLGHKMAQHGIHCHLILGTSDDVSSFKDMFYEHARLQNLEEVALAFEPDFGKHKFHFAARRPDLRPTAPRPESSLTILPRSFSYPSDLHSLASSGDVASFPEAQGTAPAPTLVNTIQQTWGLTKKKIYTAQPAQKPFIRDERVDEHQHQTPTPLPISPTSSVPFPTRDPRSKTKSWRRGEKPSPIVLPSRRPGPYPRRSSLITPLSSPLEVSEVSWPSPAPSICSTVTSSLDHDTLSTYVSSPMASPNDALYAPQPSTIVACSPATSPPMDHPGTGHVGIGSAWQNVHQGNVPSPLSAVSHPQPAQDPTFSSLGPSEPTSYFAQTTPVYPYNPAPQQRHATAAHPPQQTMSPAATPRYTPFPPIPQFSSRLLEAASMDGNVPFIFNEEKEKEAKALLKAAGLQEVPLPQIVAASLSARGRNSLPSNIGSCYTSLKAPSAAPPSAWPQQPSSSWVTTPPAHLAGAGSCAPFQVDSHNPSFCVPLSQEPAQGVAPCSFETGPTRHVIQGTSSLAGWNR